MNNHSYGKQDSLGFSGNYGLSSSKDRDSPQRRHTSKERERGLSDF